MRYRVFTEDDFQAMSKLDLLVQQQDPGWASLPEREQEGRLRTSLPALRFYLRSEHSFIAEEREAGNETPGGLLTGIVFAQSVWMGDKPIILVTTRSRRNWKGPRRPRAATWPDATPFTIWAAASRRPPVSGWQAEATPTRAAAVDLHASACPFRCKATVRVHAA